MGPGTLIRANRWRTPPPSRQPAATRATPGSTSPPTPLNPPTDPSGVPTQGRPHSNDSTQGRPDSGRLTQGRPHSNDSTQGRPDSFSTGSRRCPHVAIICRPGAGKSTRFERVSQSAVRRFRPRHVGALAQWSSPPARSSGPRDVQFDDCASNAVWRSMAAAASRRLVGVFRNSEPHAAPSGSAGLRRHWCDIHRCHRSPGQWGSKASARAGTSSPSSPSQPKIVAWLCRHRTHPTDAGPSRRDGPPVRAGSPGHD